MRVLAALLLCLCVLTPGSLFGQGQTYIEGFFGSTSYGPSSVPVDLDQGSAFGLWGGYAFSSNFAFEVGYVNYGEYSISTDIAIAELDIVSLSAEAEISSFNFGAKGVLPLDGGFFLTGKIGMALWDATGDVTIEYSDNTITLPVSTRSENYYIGCGASYLFSDTVYATVDYLSLQAQNVSVVSIGIGMLF
jgi:hypothetical protein